MPHSNETISTTNELEVHAIHLDDQGYDDNGSYWGTGTPLFWVTTLDGKHDCFVRADDMTHARLIATEEFPLRAAERAQSEIDRSAPAIIDPEHQADGTYRIADELLAKTTPPSADRRRTAIQQADSQTVQTDGAVQASPTRPTAKAGGSGPTGKAGPT